MRVFMGLLSTVLAMTGFVTQVNALAVSEAMTVPDWVSASYCETWANPAACSADLALDPDNQAEGDLPIPAQCTYFTASGKGDYSEACYYTWHANTTAMTQRFTMQNGAHVVLTQVAVDGPFGKAGNFLFNDLPAEAVTTDAMTCAETIDKKERFCFGAYRPELWQGGKGGQ